MVGIDQRVFTRLCQSYPARGPESNPASLFVSRRLPTDLRPQAPALIPHPQHPMASIARCGYDVGMDQPPPTLIGPQGLLIVVHPGSACGSADMNLGFAASEMRGALTHAIGQWDGAVAVIDGDLSDQLSGGKREWSDLGDAIDGALEQARGNGFAAVRIDGDDDSDFNQDCAAEKLVEDLGLVAGQHEIILAGAWYHSSDGGGCVGGVRDTLEQMGFSVSIDTEAVMDLDADTGMDDDLDDEMDDAGGRDATDDAGLDLMAAGEDYVKPAPRRAP